MTHAWFDAECRAARRRARAAERIVLRLRRRSGTEMGLEVEAEGCCMNTRNTTIGEMTLPPAKAANVDTGHTIMISARHLAVRRAIILLMNLRAFCR